MACYPADTVATPIVVEPPHRRENKVCRLTGGACPLVQDAHVTAIETAARPEQLRGFCHVREASIKTLIERWETLRRELENPYMRGTGVVRIIEPVAA